MGEKMENVRVLSIKEVAQVFGGGAGSGTGIYGAGSGTGVYGAGSGTGVYNR